MIARYNFAFRSSTYDVANWLAHVNLLGAREIVFQLDGMRSTKWSFAESMKRFGNYISPMPSLYGLPSRVGNDGEDQVGSPYVHDLQADLVRLGKPLPRMSSPFTRKVKYTVTIRESAHNPFKNSDRALWHRFADKIGAHVIEDAVRTPITLFNRVSLYSGARMNFGVPNGPMALLYYTPWPFRIMADPIVNAKSFGGHRIRVGGTVPWLLPDQCIIWERATIDNLMREFEQIEAVAA